MSVTFSLSTDQTNLEDRFLGSQAVNMSWTSANQLLSALGFRLSEDGDEIRRADLAAALEDMDENYDLAVSDRPFLATPVGRQLFRELRDMVTTSSFPLVTYG